MAWGREREVVLTGAQKGLKEMEGFDWASIGWGSLGDTVNSCWNGHGKVRLNERDMLITRAALV